jgi:hypothetical protein
MSAKPHIETMYRIGGSMRVVWLSDYEALQHRAERAEALAKYADHRFNCNARSGFYKDGIAHKCDCGFDEARKALEDTND